MKSLLFNRRFGWMFVAMAIGAFNDNYYKNAVIILFTYVLASSMSVSAEVLISVAAASFILPFFLFSGFAGILADRFPKHQIVRLLKVTELLIVLAAFVALMGQHATGLLVLLFLLGMQAAFFGPTKYAIIPELVRPDELIFANGLIEAGTFVSILLGTILGGLLILLPQGTLIVGSSMVGMSLLGLLAAWHLPPTRAAMPGLNIPRNPLASLWSMLHTAWSNSALRTAIIGISWFWAIGAIYLTQIPVFTKDVIGGNPEVVTWFLSLFSIGIAVGSLLCPWLVRRFRIRHLSPLALLGVCLFGLGLAWAGYHTVRADELIGIHAYLSGNAHWRVTLGLFLMAVCGGIFTIPLYTRLQQASSTEQRARTIASNNVMNALFIALASMIAAALYALQWGVCDVLLLFALANLPVVALLWNKSRS